LGHLVHLPGEAAEAEGEPVERPAAVALREARVADMRGFWEDRSDDLAEGSDQIEDLTLSHPSYQDVSGNRRRRRRRIGEELPAREKPGLPTRGELASPPGGGTAGLEELPVVSRGGRPERGRGRGRDRGNGRESASLELAAAEPATSEAFFGKEKVSHEGEERRGRSRRDSHKPPAEPPEVVAVEMTPEEQDVYAWMGISPLILARQEVKNPRSAIISVVLPGQAPPPDILAAASPPTPEDTVVSAEVTAELEPELESAAAVATLAETASSRPTRRVTKAAPPVLEAEPLEAETPDSDEQPAIRRRRRRSSATTADS
jgi:ribonuclease E